MVVVVIITLLAAIAVPGISRQLANRRARGSADFIASLYRNARLRAMARGSAVLVRYTASSSTYEVREAIFGTTTTVNSRNVKTNLRNDDTCAQLPVSSCTATLWGAADTGNQLLETFRADGQGQIVVTMQNPNAPTTDLASLDVCFTPTGKTYSAATGNALTPLVGVARASVKLATGVGLVRQVVIPSNGVARVNAL